MHRPTCGREPAWHVCVSGSSGGRLPEACKRFIRVTVGVFRGVHERACMSGRAAAQTQRDAAEIGWNGGVGLGGVACTQRRVAAACRSDSDSGIPTPPSPEALIGGVSALASELHCMRWKREVTAAR